MCEQRWKTRDRLLEYDINVSNLDPNPIIISNEFPWGNLQLSVLSQQLYTIATNNGYTGTRDEFITRFSTGVEPNFIICDSTADFPAQGSINTLYLDSSTNILYYATSSDAINTNLLSNIGGFISDTIDNVYYFYIPVRAMPIENIILDGGEA